MPHQRSHHITQLMSMSSGTWGQAQLPFRMMTPFPLVFFVYYLILTIISMEHQLKIFGIFTLHYCSQYYVNWPFLFSNRHSIEDIITLVCTFTASSPHSTRGKWIHWRGERASSPPIYSIVPLKHEACSSSSPPAAAPPLSIMTLHLLQVVILICSSLTAYFTSGERGQLQDRGDKRD
jgi:hypothetical protein